MGFVQLTVNGYDFYETYSAFHKSVRQGKEKEALYWMVELFNSGYEKYLWRRIRIIISEDIGLAEPTLPATIAALEDNYNREKEEKISSRPERLFLVHAVLLLVRAKKSRLNDWTVLGVWLEHKEEKLPIPDDALDKHTARGKRMGRGMDHFFNVGSVLANHEQLNGEQEAKNRAYVLLKKYPDGISFEKTGRMHQAIKFNETNDSEDQGNLF